MTAWRETLYRELDEWNYDGVAATVWWRDDDAQSSTAELERILDLAQKYAAPLGLAVIPQGMDDTLAARIESTAVSHSVTARVFPRQPRPAR